jgi:hypothetical protein
MKYFVVQGTTFQALYEQLWTSLITSIIPLILAGYGETHQSGRVDRMAGRVWLSETAMYRYEQLISGKLSLRDYNGRVAEALSEVRALNKTCTLGMPLVNLVMGWGCCGSLSDLINNAMQKSREKLI